MQINKKLKKIVPERRPINWRPRKSVDGLLCFNKKSSAEPILIFNHCVIILIVLLVIVMLLLLLLLL